MEFPGFNPKIYDFFVELAENNNKEWFDEHRKFYEKEIRDRTREFVEDMAYRFGAAGLPYLSNKKNSLFRINRDIRFSKDKSPYKTNLGFYFPFSLEEAQKKAPEVPGLYFHFEPGLSFFAAGVHMPDSQTAKNIRVRISEEFETFLDIIKSNQLNNEYDKILIGESLKRIPRGFDKDDPASEFLKLKEFTVYGECDGKLLFEDSFQDEIIRKAEISAPLLKFLKEASNS